MKAALARKDFDEAVTWHDKEVTLREKADACATRPSARRRRRSRSTAGTSRK